MRCVPAPDFTVAKARAWRFSIDDAPRYQRAGDLWTLGQRQRFIDSLVNGYDVPKIYLHDLRGTDPRKVYAVVDGKQRLTAIWQFLDDGFALADDFLLEGSNGLAGQGDETAAAPCAGRSFSGFGPTWQAALLGTFLAVVLIQDATEVDIEELFSRLNNGVPLDPAERRHALGGDTMEIVREIAARPSLVRLLSFPDVRRSHADVAARLVAFAAAQRQGRDDVIDTDPEGLETFVRQGRHLDPVLKADLLQRTDRLLLRAAGTLGKERPRLEDPETAFIAIRAAAMNGTRSSGPRTPMDQPA